MKVRCKNCGDDIELPEPEPKRFHFDFGLRHLWDNLFSEVGIVVLFIVCGIGLPIILSGRDSEYDAIKKALETPGIKVEVSKSDKGDVSWKIMK